MISLHNDNFEILIYPPVEGDPHFATRYNHLGYIANIYSKQAKKYLLTRPTDDFRPFDGDGFPDEFEKPIRYNESKVGEAFVKLGVGEEKKLGEVPYTNWDLHPILKLAHSTYSNSEDKAIFSQQLESEGIKYLYTKTISLTDKGFNISHRITNIGQENIPSMWYSHCFLDIAGLETMSLTLPSHFVERANVTDDIRTTDAHKYLFPNTYDARGVCYNWDVDDTLPNEYSMDFGDYVLNAKCDTPCYEFQLYVNKRIISPEPKIGFEIKPGESFCFGSKYELLFK